MEHDNHVRYNRQYKNIMSKMPLENILTYQMSI